MTQEGCYLSTSTYIMNATPYAKIVGIKKGNKRKRTYMIIGEWSEEKKAWHFKGSENIKILSFDWGWIHKNVG